MGILRRLNQERKRAIRQTKMSMLVRAIEEFYATHAVAPWQGERVTEIRNIHNFKVKALEREFLKSKQMIQEEFMQHELDFLHASFKFREENPGKEWRAESEGFLGWIKSKFGIKGLVTAPTPAPTHGNEKEGE